MPVSDPTEDRLYQDAELAQFYDLENDWAADQDYCRELAREARSVLDLGCGTGRLAAELAGAREVVGVDPAEPMLDIARARTGGAEVEWVPGDARHIRLGRRFDLVVLTGHAFQVFLTNEDQRALLTTIAAHLTPEGRFVFDSRNPDAGEWREWTPDASRRAFEHPTLGRIEAWNDVSRDPGTGIVTYQTHYHVVGAGRRLSASSHLRFSAREELERLIGEAGLQVDRWLGRWNGDPWTTDSLEIIPLGRLRR